MLVIYSMALNPLQYTCDRDGYTSEMGSLTHCLKFALMTC